MDAHKQEIQNCKNFLHEYDVPFAKERPLLESIMWLARVHDAAKEREDYIEEHYGISVIHNKAGQILPFDVDIEKLEKVIEKQREDIEKWKKGEIL